MNSQHIGIDVSSLGGIVLDQQVSFLSSPAWIIEPGGHK